MRLNSHLFVVELTSQGLNRSSRLKRLNQLPMKIVSACNPAFSRQFSDTAPKTSQRISSSLRESQPGFPDAPHRFDAHGRSLPPFGNPNRDSGSKPRELPWGIHPHPILPRRGCSGSKPRVAKLPWGTIETRFYLEEVAPAPHRTLNKQ